MTHFENESGSGDLQNYWRLYLWTNSTKMSEYMREKNIVGKEKGKNIMICEPKRSAETLRERKRNERGEVLTLHARN